jgi:group I intron endonuclease
MEDYKGHAIYKIVSKKNGRIYVGSSVCFIKRKKQHIYDLKNKKHCNIKLLNHYNKYDDDLYFEVLEKVKHKENLIKREQYYIDTLNPFFNICKKAGSSLGRKKPLEKILQELKEKKEKELWLEKNKIIFELIDSIV